MKRFWLFGAAAGNYARGGLADLIGSFDTTAEAQQAAAKDWEYSDNSGTYQLWWFHIADMETQQVVVAKGQALGAWFELPTGPIQSQDPEQ